MGEWRADVAAGRRPAVAFNAMVVETGQRAVFATYAFPGGPASMDLESITGGKDVPVVTAARLAATFPYVTPAARAANDADDVPKVHLIDGGYWDNHAIVTVLEWLLNADLGDRPVLVIRIPPPSEPQPAQIDRAWPWQMIAPLQAGISVRTDAQQTRNDLEKTLYEKGHNAIVWADFPYRIKDKASETLLSWHLSRHERCAIEKVWSETYGNAANPEIRKIVGVLGVEPKSWNPSSSEECPQ